jgi:UDP-N-acetylmuramoylalanine--D-glutamate ligase
MNLAEAHILVIGAGRSGSAAAKLLVRRGARVTVYDRDAERLAGLDDAPELRDVARRSGDLPDFDAFDSIVASPGVPLAPDPRIVPEVDLAAEWISAPIVGVTGTNGKSTCCVLIGDMLRASGFAVGVGGNLGTALCEFVDAPLDRVVAELSSFQLEHARKLGSAVAVLLNLSPDHLDRHGTLERYGAAKARLAELQPAHGVLVVNREDDWASDVGRARRAAGAEVREFSTAGAVADGCGLDRGDLVLVRAGEEQLRVPLDTLSAASRSPVDNALAAAAAAFAAGASADGIASALREFAGLPHRTQLVCTRGGVRYVDDSKATNPAAAASSLGAEGLRGESGGLWWLAGGRNKGLDFAPLADAARGVSGAIVFGEAAAELARTLEGATELISTPSMEDAVRAAAERAGSGDVVLLSPGCASFDEFSSFEARGERFAEIARGLPC